MNNQKAILKIRDLLNLHERRDLDSFIASRIMGWTKITRTAGDKWVGVRPGSTTDEEVPHYHIDMGEAWAVVKKLQSKYPWLRVQIIGGDTELEGKYKVQWLGHPDKDKNTGQRLGSAENITLELALCVSFVELIESVYKI